MSAIPAGYKQTEVGVIPEDWESISAVDACSKIQDGTHFSPRISGNDYFYVTSKNIRFGYLDMSTASRIDAAQHQAIYRRCDVKLGDILLTKDGANTGNAALNTLTEEFSLLSSVAFLRFQQSKHCGSYFLQQILATQGQRQIQEAMAGNAITRLTLQKINKLRFPIPPTKAEQEAIAEALSDADALIESLEQLLAKKRHLKQAAMQELLTGKKRLPGFSGAWERQTLGSIIDGLEAGVSVNSLDGQPRTGEPSILKTSAMVDGRFLPIECKVIAPFDASRARANPRKDTILISRMNTPDLVGEVGYVDDEYPWLFLPDRIWMTRFRTGSEICVRWLAYLLSSAEYKRLIQGAATGTSGSMKNISKPGLLSLSILFPSYPEQSAIASILSDMDAELADLETQFAKTRALKQGMMQKLLTGEIRLV